MLYLDKDAKRSLKIALVGDYNSSVIAHQALGLAIELSAKMLQIDAKVSWIPTVDLTHTALSLLEYQGIWCVPGSPYQSMIGALRAISFAREIQVPFLGTCGGFQHVLIEYARNVLHLPESDHLESNPQAVLPLISPLACSLVGTTGTIFLKKGSRIQKIYDKLQVEEVFNCHFGINPTYKHLLENRSDLRITGMDSSGNVRIVELCDHPFFIATLYQPERSALTGKAHPLIKAFLQAAEVFGR